MATAADLVTQIAVRIEGHRAGAASRFFIAAAHAKRGSHRNDGGGQFQIKNADTKGDGDGRPEAKDTDSKGNGDGRPEATNTDNKGNEDGQRDVTNTAAKAGGEGRSRGSAGNAETTEGTARKKEKSTEPPKTLAEAIERLIKWTQPRPQAIPPWVTRITRENTDRPRAKLAQKTQATKRPQRPSVAGNIIAGTYRPNELLVLNADPATLDRLNERRWRKDSSVARGVVRLISETEDPLVALEQLQTAFPTARFSPNFVYYHPASTTNPTPGAIAGRGPCDPQRCYGPELIKWRADLAACAAGVRIGIIDTSVDAAHPALAWKRLKVRRPNAEPASAEPHWHGTGVVSLLAGSPDSGTPGLIPGADYIIRDVFTKRLGKVETDTDHLLWALDELEQQGAQVVNMSLTGPRDDLVHQRLIELSKKGMIFVAAAGNDHSNGPAYPAAYKREVIAVTAVDRDRRIYGPANRGDYIDVAAPGVRIWTALPNGKEGMQSGTSFAAPFVTAIVAAIYNNALRPAISDLRGSRGPEAVTLAYLPTAKFVGDETVGLVMAPSSCAPGGRRRAPTVQLTPPIEPNGWKTLVHHASQALPQEAPPLALMSSQ